MSDLIIELKDIFFSYDGETEVLKGLSLEVKQGEWLAIIGPNGSGKSTLARIINGLLEPTKGMVKVDNIELTEESLWDVRSKVGMVFQNPDNQFVGATVEDDVAFGLENHGIPRDEMLERVPQALKEVRMNEYLNHEPARLSGGQKQRVAVASIIAIRPDIIILDEATAMLDPTGRREIMEIIDRIKQDFNLTVISITHDLDEASRADRIVVLNDGQVQYQAKPEEIFMMSNSLIDLGLDVPFAQKLQKELHHRGVDIPMEYMNEEALIKWIKKSLLTM